MKFLRFSKQNHAWQNNVATSVYFLANFRNLATKKKVGGGGRGAGESNKGIFEIFLTNSPYLDQKNLEVARFRHCVPAGRQSGQDFKKDLLVHQDSRHLLLINAEDPSQCTYLRNLKKKNTGGNFLVQ
jgi:hypothetical protein